MERQKLVDFCGDLCVCMCVFGRLRGGRGSRQKEDCKYLTSCFSAPISAGLGWAQPVHAHQEIFSLWCPLRNKLGAGYCGSFLSMPPCFLSSFPTPQEWENPALKGPLPDGTRRQKVLPSMFFLSNWFKNLMCKQSWILIRLLLQTKLLKPGLNPSSVREL